MQFSIAKFVLVLLGSAAGTLLWTIRHFIWTGDSPDDDGPSALIAEFLGTWIGISFLIWSFTVEGRKLQWELRGLGALAAAIGIGFSVYFGNKTQVPETPDTEPTGFKSDATDLHLE